MKKVTIADQLDLSREIVASLSGEQLQEVEGGVGRTFCTTISCIGTISCNTSNIVVAEEVAE